MSFFDFFGGKVKRVPERNRFLVLDIGAGYLKGGILNIQKKDKYSGEVIVCKKERRESFSAENKKAVDYEELKDNISRLISSLRNSIKRDTPKNAIFCFDQVFAETRSMVIKEYRNKPKEKIDLPELKNIFSHIVLNMRERLNKNQVGGEIKILDAKIQEIIIDGYKISNPLGFEGKEISFSVVLSCVSRLNYEIIRKLKDDLNVDIVAVCGDIFCAAYSQTYGKRSGENFLFVDFGSSATQLALIRRGCLIKVNYFNMGTDAFTQKISSELGVGFSEAEEIIIKYVEKKLSEFVFKKIDKMLENEKTLWRNGIMVALEEMGEVGNLPRFITVIGGGAKFPFVPKFFEKDDSFLEFFGEDEGPKIFNPASFESLVENKSDSDPLSLYFGIFSSSFRFLGGFNEDAVEQNFKRIIKMKKE